MAKKKEEVVEIPKFDPKEGEVMTYKSYYHLYRKTKSGRHLVFRKHYERGWFGFEAKENEIKPTPIDTWISEGASFAPFTAADFEEFKAMSDEDLLKFIK